MSSEVALVPSDQALRDRAWELHLTGATFGAIAREVSSSERKITYHAVSRWIAERYDELQGTPPEKLELVRQRAVQRLNVLTRKGFKALEAFIPSDDESSVGFTFQPKHAPSVARLLEVLARLEEVRARIEGTIAVGQGANAEPPGGGALPSGVLEQRWVIVRRGADGVERSLELGRRVSGGDGLGLDPLALEPG